MSDNIFGARIKSLREDRNLSMIQLGKAIGVSDAAICKWEGGITEPKVTFITRLADFFDCSADFLIGKTDEYGYPQPNDPMNITVSKQEMQLIDAYRNLTPSQQNLLIDTAKAWKK